MPSTVAAIRAYHEASKHHTHAYAPGPGFLDWDAQPDPFRRYHGAPATPLPLHAGPAGVGWHALMRGTLPPPRPPDAAGLGLFCGLALGLTAWKGYDQELWPLRANPSSGNLHPTEGYVILWQPAGDDLPPGVYHYAPHDHLLERRCTFAPADAAALRAACPQAWGAFGLSSIPWREAWKYGARAFRYCQHDVGHALGAARLAAGVAGWGLCAAPTPTDAQAAAILGLDRLEDRGAAEAEHPDLLALFGPHSLPPAALPLPDLLAAAGRGTWAGRASVASAERVQWPEIAAAEAASVKHTPAGAWTPSPAPPPEGAAQSGPDAAILIRQRRSAQRMDPKVTMARGDFLRLLARCLPGNGLPWDAFPYAPAVDLLLFVHGVDDLAPGIYRLDRSGRGMGLPPGAAVTADLPALTFLRPEPDLRRLASQLSCHQGIAGRSAFSLGMVADLSATLEAHGAWSYRRLLWECGLIGQVLYMEAEASGLRGTGIGCFFDDAVLQVAGLPADPGGHWQSLYHFTVGGAVEDARIASRPAYAHLTGRAIVDALTTADP